MHEYARICYALLDPQYHLGSIIIKECLNILNLKSSFQKYDGRNYKLTDPCGILVSQFVGDVLLFMIIDSLFLYAKYVFGNYDFTTWDKIIILPEIYVV